MGGWLWLLASVFPAECASPACQWASARLSLSPDPFTHPCDYFLSACTSDKLSSSSVTGPRNQDSYSHPQSLMGAAAGPRGGSARHEKRENGEEDMLDRNAALLLYLREVLGRALHLQSSVCVCVCVPRPALCCFPLSHPSDFPNRHQSRRTAGAARRCRRPEDSTGPAWTPSP